MEVNKSKETRWPTMMPLGSGCYRYEEWQVRLTTAKKSSYVNPA